MRKLRMQNLKAPLALFVAMVFFAAQAFACCMATRDLAAALASAFRSPPATPAAPDTPAAPAHACCPKADAAPANAPTDCNSMACCIRDAGQKPPQLASAPATIPDLSGSTLARLEFPVASILLAPLPARSAATGPPVWLGTVRILV